MRLPNHIFRNPHPGIAVVLFGTTAGLTAVYNYLLDGEGHGRLMERGLISFLVGFSAWLINVVLVYRSKYLKPNYLLGWYWFCLLLASNPQGIGYMEIVSSVVFAVWLAFAFDLHPEGIKGLASRSNFGLLTAVMGMMWPEWWSLLLVALLTIQVSLIRQPLRHILQILVGWLIGVLLLAIWHAYTDTLGDFWNQFIAAFPREIPWHWPSSGQWVIGFWLVLAGVETVRALSMAKKSKRRGLLIGWLGILWALLLDPWQGPNAQAGAILAVFAAPHLVNLQTYFKRPWIIRILDISLLATAFGLVISA